MSTSTSAGTLVTPRMRALINKAGSGFLLDRSGGDELRSLYQQNSTKFYAAKTHFDDFTAACYYGDDEYVKSAFVSGRASPLNLTVSEYKIGLATLIVFGAGNIAPLNHTETENQKNRHLRTLEFLLAHGLPPDIPDVVGSPAIIHAAMRVNEKMPALIRALVAGGANIDHRNIYGTTAIHDAILTGQAASVEVLMELGARLDLPNGDGITTMDMYVNYGPEVTAVIGKWLRRRAGAGKAPLEEKSCAKCGKLGSEQIKLKKCSSCHAVFYCSTDCQRVHWKTHKKICKTLSSDEDAVTLKPSYMEVPAYLGLQPAAAAYRASVHGMHEEIPESHSRTAHQPKKFPKSLLVKIQVPYAGPPLSMAISGGNFMVYSKKRDFVAQIRRQDSPTGYDQLFNIISTKGPGGAKGYFLAELKSATELVVKTEILAEQPF